MRYYVIGNDETPFDHPLFHKAWIEEGNAYASGDGEYGRALGRLKTGDVLFCYFGEIGLVAVGTVTAEWDGKGHRAPLYAGRPEQGSVYKIGVDWHIDLTCSPIPYKDLAACGTVSVRQTLQEVTGGTGAQLLALAKHHGGMRPPGVGSWHHAAGLVWPLLTAAAVRGETLKYGDIAPQIPTNPRSVGRALAPIQDYCLENRLPPLTSIVIGRATGLPGKGFIAWDFDDLGAAHRAVFAFPWGTVANPFAGFGSSDTVDTLSRQLLAKPGSSAEVYAKVRVRGLAQVVFREALLVAYRRRCAICGLGFTDALEAAHIIPWQRATASQRLDPQNGLLLCATHHRLLDAGLITVSSSFHVVCRDPGAKGHRPSEIDRSMTVALHGTRIGLPDAEQHWPRAEWLRTQWEGDDHGDL